MRIVRRCIFALVTAGGLIGCGHALAVEPATEYRQLLAAYEREGGVRLFAKRFLTFAQNNVKDPAAVDALVWLVDHLPGRSEAAAAIALLAEHHATSDKIGAACKPLAAARSVGAEPLLRQLLEKHPDPAVQAQAGFHLAQLLDREATIVEQLRANQQLAPRILQYYGPEYGAHLAALEPAQLAKKREAVYQRLLDAFPGEDVGGEKLADVARDALYEIRHLSVGKVAPEIEGTDLHGKRFQLSDYRGKVVMLSFWAHW